MSRGPKDPQKFLGEMLGMLKKADTASRARRLIAKSPDNLVTLEYNDNGMLVRLAIDPELKGNVSRIESAIMAASDQRRPLLTEESVKDLEKVMSDILDNLAK